MASKNTHSAERRKRALLIANDHYAKNENKLPDCTKNAYRLRDALMNIHFEVEMMRNIQNEMIDVVKPFHEKVRNGDLILFYFFGHAYSVEGKIYLLPTDDKQIKSKIDVKDLGTDVERIIKRIIGDKSSCSVISILDCCRPYLLNEKSTSSGEFNGIGFDQSFFFSYIM